MRPHAATSAFALLALIAGACSPEVEAPPEPFETTQAPVAPAAPPAPPINYACESGMTVAVQYPDTATAQLTYKTQTYALRTAPSASGARYAGSGLEWVTATGNAQESATLSRLGPNEDIGVAVLERCSRPAGTTVPTGPQPAPVPILPGAPGTAIPSGIPCRGPQLKLSAEGGDAGAGNRVSVLGIQNVGTQACSLTGYPGVTLQDGQGQNLTTIRPDQNPGNYFRTSSTPTPVLLQPQGKAFFDIAWNIVPNQGAGERTCPSAARIRVTAPGDTSAVSLDQAFTPCGGRVRVSPFRPVVSDVPAP